MKQLILLCAFLVSVSGEPIVEGSLGRFTGTTEKILDLEIEAFLGVPYAKPPLKDLRFALPKPFGPVGDLQATEFSPPCPQPRTPYTLPTEPAYNEDCLYLNVFRKQGTRKNDKKAVIAVIHGGGYMVGAAAHEFQSPRAMAAFGDVIVVNFNYRLGILGFADMKHLAPGNLGLHDQRLALQWIQDNIDDFGGDPDRVTMMGVSAGAMSAAAHIITPIDEKDLFQAAVLDAGVIASNGFYEDSESSYSRVKKIAVQSGCPVDSLEMVDCLRKANIDDLLPISIATPGNNGLMNFVATMDGVFVPRDVERYVEENSAKLRKVRTIIGYSQDEGTFFVGSSFLEQHLPDLKKRDEIIEYIGKLAFRYDLKLDFTKNSVKELVGKLYADKHPDSAFDAVAALQGDGIFKCPTNSFIESYSKHNDEIYVYHFERKLKATYHEFLDPSRLGVFHFSPYLHFTGVLLGTDETIEPSDKLYSLDAINTISNFAKSEKPPTFREMEWPSYSKSEQVLVFNEIPSVRKGLLSQQACRELFVPAAQASAEKLKTEL